MNKRFRRLINIYSIVFIGLLFLFYGYRLIYYYKLEHNVSKNEIIKFYQKLINNKGIDGMNYGLQKSDNGYLFGPKSTDNYLYYAGRLWRIIGVDENNNMKLITDESQTILSWEDETNFGDSNINTWLNNNENEYSGMFEKSMKDQISKVIPKDDSTITLLTTEEYEAIGKNNYLINETNFWVINKDNNIRTYINEIGEISTDCEDHDAFNVRPVITISSEFDYISGSGTVEDPYIIYNHGIEKLTDAFVGEYLKFDNKTWRVIETKDDSIKIALEGYLETEENIIFSKYDNEFMYNDGIGEYLNSNYYETLEYKDYIIEKDYYVGSFSINNKYSYLNTYTDSNPANIGIYKIGDFFINTYSEFFTLTPSEASYKTIYTINKNKKLFADFIDSEYKIRPVLYLDNKIFILNGDGTKNNPYEIGR